MAASVHGNVQTPDCICWQKKQVSNGRCLERIEIYDSQMHGAICHFYTNSKSMRIMQPERICSQNIQRSSFEAVQIRGVIHSWNV